MRTSLRAAVLLSCIPFATLQAQQVGAGDRVRVQQFAAGKGAVTLRTGTLERVAGDTLYVVFTRDEPASAVPLTTIERMDRWQRDSRTHSALKWGPRGLLIGAFAGSTFCLADKVSCKANEGNGESLSRGVLSFAVFYAALGLVTGTVGGAAFPAHQWTPLPSPFQVRTSVMPSSAGLLIGVSATFE